MLNYLQDQKPIMKKFTIKAAVMALLFAVSLLFTNNALAKNDVNDSDKKILFIISSDQHGFYMSEVIEPYQLLQQAGYSIEIASPMGGAGKKAGMSRLTEQQRNWFEQSKLAKQLQVSKPLNIINSNDYAAVYFPGGSGPMFDLADNRLAQNITRDIYQAGGIVAADCHGPAALINVKLSNGQRLVSGKNITAKANIEEGSWARRNYPFLLEDKFIALGAHYSKGAKGSVHVVVDDRLITGQNPASANLMAEKLIQRLAAQQSQHNVM